ncbi:MAG: hypothetical protein AAF716_12340 [Cyanobacteria bacterium P01_D01_bin.1]
MTGPVYQDSIVIGEILSQTDEQLVFESNRVLLGDRTPTQITITDYTPSQAEALSSGDFAVLSLVQVDRSRLYSMSHPAFKVSSPEPSEAKIIAGPLLDGDRIAYNWFINSCGAESDFAFDYSGEVGIVFVRRKSGLSAIARRSVDTSDASWERIAEPPDCKPERFSWWQSLLRRLSW